MKKGIKSKKRKRGAASRRRKIRKLQLERYNESKWREKEKRLHRLKELEEETQDIFNKVIEPYTLSNAEKHELEFEWKLGLDVIFYYEDATPEELLDLPIYDCEGTTFSELVENWDDLSESFWRASYELSNALGLATITIGAEGNISGDRVEY